MLPVAMHFASGNSLLSGLGMICLAYALLLAGKGQSRGGRLAMRVLAFLGGVFIVLSTTPFHGLVWIALGLCMLPLLAGPIGRLRVIRLGALTFAVIALSLVWSEYLSASPRLPPLSASLPVIVFGDSLSAAETDPALQAWPALLEQQGWVVHNLAGIGATAGSALRKAANVETSDAIVLLVIGGNDLLGSTKPEEYEASLDELVRRVSSKGTDVVLFELPLPPFRFEWGSIPRRIAEKHGCRLVTRRVIATVLGDPQNTVDGIHLSQKGHDTMARLVLETVLPPR